MLRRIGIKSEMASKIFDLAVLGFALLGAAQLGVWAFDRGVPVTVHWRSVVYDRVRPGGEFRYVNDFTRTKFCEAEVQRWIVDRTTGLHQIATLNTGMPTEGLNQRQISMARIPIPKDIPDGPAKACFQSRWACNPLQKYAGWPIVGPATCIGFTIDSSAAPMTYAPIGRVTLAETWP